MAVTGEIEGISIPFVLGVLSGAGLAGCARNLPFSPAAVPLSSGSLPGLTAAFRIPALSSTAALVCISILIILLVSGRAWRHGPSLLFFCLGVFTFCSRSMCVDMSDTEPVLASEALRRLKALINGIAFPHNESNGLLLALLTGDRSGLSSAQTASFRSAGAAHILALSGLHLGLIYMMADKFLSLMGHSAMARHIRSFLCVCLSLFFTVMTGAGPSIVRAFLFITFREISRLDPERKARPEKILFSALMVQLVLFPSVVLSVGFQLSYLAVCGIVYVFPRLKAWYPAEKRDSLMHRIWDAVCLTLSCQMFTGPLSWLRFHSFPKYFLLTNLIALPLTGVIMTLAVGIFLLSAFHICPPLLVRLEDIIITVFYFVLDAVCSM